jgi:hypothetical protein
MARKGAAAMSRLTKRQLQAALDKLARANNTAREARDAIYAHSEAVYGATPGEIDNDDFIDAVDGGCGASGGMTADQFHESMTAAGAKGQP